MVDQVQCPTTAAGHSAIVQTATIGRVRDDLDVGLSAMVCSGTSNGSWEESVGQCGGSDCQDVRTP